MCGGTYNIENMINILLNDISELVYVSDPQTYEVLYANDNVKHIIKDDLLHKKCYEVLQGRDKPCDYCTNNIILNCADKNYTWEYYNPIMKKHFMIKDKVITWDDGRDVRLEYALDISYLKNMEEKLTKRLRFEKLINEISKKFIGLFEFEKTIQTALQKIGEMTKCSRVYIFNIDDETGYMNNTYEWCAPAIPSEIQNLQNLSVEQFSWWIGELNEKGIINIEDVNKMTDDSLEEKTILQRQQIKSLLAFPLYGDMRVNGFMGIDNTQEQHLWNDEDISLLNVSSQIISNAIDRYTMEQKLRKSEKEYKDIFENTGAATIIIDKNMAIVLANEEFCNLTRYTKEDTIHLRLMDLFTKADYQRIQKYFNNIPDEIKYKNIKIRLLGKNNIFIDVTINITKMLDSNKFIISFLSIADKTAMNKKIKHLIYYDMLTNVYNRQYFEQQVELLKKENELISIMMCDIDGLKLINDTVGHIMGDKILKKFSQILKDSIEPDDIIARIGGDEFVIILRTTNKEALIKTHDSIYDNITLHNNKHPETAISVSIGYAAMDSSNKAIDDVLKEADDNMNKEKVHHRKSIRSSLINTLTKALEARDYVTEGHTLRMEDLIADFSKDLVLPQHKIADLKLLARFHDIGKVGIPDYILFKKGPLTYDERTIMKSHSEIGHRIAKSSQDLKSVADLILKHHEWWNGEGYPLGIKKEEIPLECRILSIVDAYDAMTNDRPYRKALTHHEAVEEIKKFRGIQFDPIIADLFIKKVSKLVHE